MSVSIKLLIAAIVIAVVVSITMYVLKKRYFSKLVDLLSQSKFEEFYELSNSGIVAVLFPKFNVEYLKLNAILMEGNKRKINDQFDLLLGMRTSSAQSQEITMKAFNYYVGVEDKHKTKTLLEKINTYNNERMKEEATMTYDVFIQKKWNHIDHLLEEIEDMSEQNRAIYEYLISVQYENKGDSEKAKEYHDLSKKHMDMPVNK